MGEEQMLEEDQELELEDLDLESELEEEEEETEDHGIPETETDREAGEPETASEETKTPDAETAETPNFYERGVAKGAKMVEDLKGTADSAIDWALPRATELVNKNKGKFFQMYDSVMDLKDEMHYAKKEGGIKSAAGVLGKHIRNSDTYKKFMNSVVGRGIQAGKKGLSIAAEKFSGSRLGKWIQEKRASRSDKPGFFSKIWNKTKSGASALAETVKNGASWAADKFNGSRLGKWIQEKRASKSDEPGFFSKVWDKAKTGASALAGKVKSGASWAADKFNGTWLGKWIQKKMANKSDKPGFFSKAWGKIKTGVGALADKAKNSAAAKWLGTQTQRAGQWWKEQKEWAGDKLNTLKAWKHVNIDEALDNHEHERRVRYMERQGDTGYGQRYQDLVSQLGNIPGIKRLKGLVDGKEIDDALLELENGKESAGEKVEKMAEKGSKISQKAGSFLEKKPVAKKAKGYLGEKNLGRLTDGLSTGGLALDAVQSGASFFNSRALSKDLSKMQQNTSDVTLKRGMNFARRKADRDQMTSAFQGVKTAVSVLGKVTGHSEISGAANKALGLVEKSVTSGMDKETRKESLKGLLGGVEGYRQLKEQYKLKAPEMRRAIRHAIGISSEDDVVNADRLSTSNDIMKKAREGDQDSRAFAERMKANSAGSLYDSLGGSKIVFTTQNYKTQEA